MGYKVIKEKVLRANADTAKLIKERLDSAGTLMINIISSPGAGKTAFLEKIGPRLKEAGITLTILAGDCFTCRDAERLDKAGLEVIQINTGNACHIDASLIDKAISQVDIEKNDLIIVENVGNLVCPAEFELGEDMKIAFLNVAEGSDKAIKYPLLIKESPLALINKVDLTQMSDFDMAFCKECIRQVNRNIDIIEMSVKTGQGLDEALNWLVDKVKIKKEKAS